MASASARVILVNMVILLMSKPELASADQIGVWRHDVEQRLVSEGLKPERAALEASLIKATFTGLVMDLFATGDTRRLSKALDSWLTRLPADLYARDDEAIGVDCNH